MKRWFRLMVTFVILALLVWLLKDINFFDVYLLVADANLMWVVLAFLATAATFVVWNFRWMYILKNFIKPDFWFFMRVLLAGSFFNTVTPGAGIGGEPFRAHYLALRYKKPRTKIFGYVLGDTFFRTAVLFVFSVFSVLFILIYVSISSSLKLILEGFLIFVVLSLGFIFFLTLKKLKFNFGAFFKKFYKFKLIKSRFENSEYFSKYINKKIKAFSSVFRIVVKKKENIYVGSILSIVFWVFNFLAAYFLFLAFGFDVNFLSVLIVFTLGNIIGSISLVPGGVGVVEGSMVLLYSAMGILFPVALLVAFLQRLIYYFFSLFIGGVSLISLRKTFNGGKSGIL